MKPEEIAAIREASERLVKPRCPQCKDRHPTGCASCETQVFDDAMDDVLRLKREKAEALALVPALLAHAEELEKEKERLFAAIKTAHAAPPKDWPQVGSTCAGCDAPLHCTQDHREGCWAERVVNTLDQALSPAPAKRGGLAAIIGQWPGDETDEEIEEGFEALKDPLRHIACGLAWDHGRLLEEIARLRRALGDVCAAAEPEGASRRCAEIAGAALARSEPVYRVAGDVLEEWARGKE